MAVVEGKEVVSWEPENLKSPKVAQLSRVANLVVINHHRHHYHQLGRGNIVVLFGILASYIGAVRLYVRIITLYFWWLCDSNEEDQEKKTC